MKSYYVQEFLNAKETWRKSFKIAVVILLIENIQMLSVYTQKLNAFEYDQFLNHIRNFIDYFRSSYFIYIRFYTIIGNSINLRIIFVIFGFLLQSILILLLLCQIFKLKVVRMKNQGLQFLAIEQNLETIVEQNHLINMILSFFFQIHHGLLQVPLLFCGFSLVTELFNFKNYSYFELAGFIFAIITIGQQITIGLLINLHQFDHRMKNYDYLGKFQSQKLHLLYAFQLIVIFLSGIQASLLLVQLFGIIKSVIQILCDYHQQIYIDYRISRLNLRIVVFTIIYQLLLIICQYGQPALKISIVLLILLCYPPLIFLTNEILIRQDLKNTNYQSRDLEKYIRRLYIIFKQQVELKKQQRLLDPKQSLEIYTFISRHLRECKMQRERKMLKNIKLKYKCFCQDFFLGIDSFQSLESMKQFAKGLIGQTLEDEIIEKANTNLALIYIYFLVQIKKVPTQAIYEVIRFSMVEKEQPLKQQAIVHKLKQDALYKFSELVKKNDLVNQKFVFKKVYQYEESLNVLKQNLCLVVKEEKVYQFKILKDFYGCILTQIIDIDMLLDIGFKLIKNIKILEKQFQLLFKTNPQNNECDTIFNIFHKYVHYNKFRPKLYRREGQIMMQFLQSAEKIIYDPGSCVIQITLLQPRGNVIRYTRSFQKAIGFKDEEIQNQNINRFMPQIIANDHDLYLDNFVERGRINVVRSAVRVILGKTKSQFVVPINTRLRIEASPTEFGATALITPVNLTYGYMMLNEQGQIEELTQNLFESVFEKHLGLELSQLKGLDCLFFIPELAKIWDTLFDDHFDRLDKRFDCQLILPMINKQMSRSLVRTRSNIFSRTTIQSKIAKQFESLPHENVVYQISVHLMSLITINLRLVIVEIPEFKQLMNQKITSRQLVQLRNRSSQLINISSQNEIPTQKTDLISSLNSPPGNGPLNECDLEYENLIEDIKMIEELRNQLATININSTTQNNQKDPFLLQNSENQLEGRIIEFQNDPSEKSNEFSEAESDLKDNAQEQQNVQYNNGSVGSRSSQNNTTALKRQIKDCLSDSKGLTVRTKLFLLFIYVLILSGFLINFLILYFNFEKIHENQNYENLPFQFSYYYNEFIIDQSYLDEVQFDFNQLSKIAFQYFLINIKNIDKTIALLPHINVVSNLTMESRTLNIVSQLTKVLNMNDQINYSEFYNNTDAFNIQISEIQNTDSTKNLLSLSVFVIVEQIILLILLGNYIYLCFQIIQMKQKIYKLFCTFSKEVIQEQFVQFSSLYTQLNNTRFRNHETDEEQFETTMMRQYQKTVTSNMLDKHNRVGKQISQKQTNSAQIFFFLFIFIYAFICSCYFVGSFILQQITQSNVSARYQEKTSFSITFNSLASTYAQQAILLNNTITSDMIDYYDVAVEQLGQLTTSLSLYQEDQNLQVYGILVENLCNLFLSELSYSYEDFQNLFTLQQCQSISILQKGLSSVVQDLYSHQLDFLQGITINQLNGFKESYQDSQIQIQRLYAQYGFQVIIELLTNQIKSLIDSTFLINAVMFAFACIIMSISLIATKLSIEKVKQQYQESKQLLTLFPFDRLMENAYVISFITHDLHFSV